MKNEDLSGLARKVDTSFSDLADAYQNVRRSDGTVDYNGLYEFIKAAFRLGKSAFDIIAVLVKMAWAWATGNTSKTDLTDERIAAFLGESPA